MSESARSCALLVLRHGESTWNAALRWQGWADPPLSDQGERQAEAAVARLADAGLTSVASSNLARACQTAEILAAGLRLRPVTVDPDLRERSVGEWEGLTVDEIEAGWPGQMTAYRERRIPSPPGGEDAPTLMARTSAALGRLARAHPGERVLVVSHGGVIRTLERALGHPSMAAGVPNLGGRWFHWFDGTLVPGDIIVPLDPDMVTAPPSR